MKGKRVMNLIALLIGVSVMAGHCEALCGSNIFNVECGRTISMKYLSSKFASDQFKPSPGEVANYLALAIDKMDPVFGEARVDELLEVAEMDSDLWSDCNDSLLQRHHETCEKVTENESLSNYCKYCTERRSQYCGQNFFQFIYMSYKYSEPFRDLLHESNRISDYAIEAGNSSYSDEAIVEYFMAKAPESRKTRVRELCAQVATIIRERFAKFFMDVKELSNYLTLEEFLPFHKLVWKHCRLIEDISRGRSKDAMMIEDSEREGEDIMWEY